MSNSLDYLKYRLGRVQPQSQTSQPERDALVKYAAGRRRLCEIGVFQGVNTAAFRRVMASDGILIAVDPFERSFFGLRGYGWAMKIAHREVARAQRGTVIWIESTGQNAPSIDAVKKCLPVDFLFIDGDHSFEGVKGDWESWSDNISIGGIVALHDSRETGGCGAELFTQEVILQDPRFSVIDVVETLTVLQRAG